MVTRLARLSLVVLTALACAEQPLTVPIETNPVVVPPASQPAAVSPVLNVAVATPGSLVQVLFVNNDARLYWIVTCERQVERLDVDQWVRVSEERSCGSAALLLPASSSVSGSVDVTASLAPGTYRFRFAVRPSIGFATEVTSNSFRVE